MNLNIKSIDEYVNSFYRRKSLLFAKREFVSAKKELVDNGHYIERTNCTYTLEELNYAIKLINLKLTIIKD